MSHTLLCFIGYIVLQRGVYTCYLENILHGSCCAKDTQVYKSGTWEESQSRNLVTILQYAQA